jgi:hypothetical protein
LGLSEIDATACTSEIEEFTKIVIEELLVLLCTDGITIANDPKDVEGIEEAFISAFWFWDIATPLFRTVTDAEKVITFGKLTEEGILPPELHITGKCHGCDPMDVNIYDFPGL